MSDTVLAETSTRPDALEMPGIVARADSRLLSLDVFRGITIAAMLLVNNPGTWSAVYAPLRHAEWHGWTPTDLIFPFFLFIVGVSMVFSFEKMRARGVGRGRLLGRAAKRAAILFALGLVLQSYPWVGFDFSQLRVPGVLQRIALAFLAASVVMVWTDRRGRLAATAALLLGYWALMTWVPVPGVGAGVLEPGRDLGAWVDRAVFGTDHLWANSRTWDPEGLLGTLPAAASVLLGAFAGDWLRSGRPRGAAARGLLAAGAAAAVAGLLWHGLFPINKALWTSSFALFTAGMAAVILALCFWLVDVRGYHRWTFPFTLFGTNAIAAYFLSSLAASEIGLPRLGGEGDRATVKGWLFDNAFAPWLSPVNASLAFAIAFVLFWMGVMWLFHRKRIFLKV